MRKHVTIDLPFTEVVVEEISEADADLSPAGLLEKVMHDCPECRAARARGETPLVMHGESLPSKRDIIRDRRPRWRDLKRGPRR